MKPGDDGSVPRAFALEQNYPNPFNPTTTISMSLPRASDWTITIYNISGQLVKEYKGRSDAGVVKVTWDAGQYSSGVYLYKAVAGEFVATKKMLLVK
jgi:flagellar hook assembly protein FlgD